MTSAPYRRDDHDVGAVPANDHDVVCVAAGGRRDYRADNVMIVRALAGSVMIVWRRRGIAAGVAVVAAPKPDDYAWLRDSRPDPRPARFPRHVIAVLDDLPTRSAASRPFG
jgi:hypothetical protein